MPVVTGDMATLPKEIAEDYGKIVNEGIVLIVGVMSKHAMSLKQRMNSIGEWLRHYPMEDPRFFTDSIYVVVQNEDSTLTYIPVEIFKKYAVEYHHTPTGFIHR